MQVLQHAGKQGCKHINNKWSLLDQTQTPVSECKRIQRIHIRHMTCAHTGLWTVNIDSSTPSLNSFFFKVYQRLWQNQYKLVSYLSLKLLSVVINCTTDQKVIKWALMESENSWVECVLSAYTGLNGWSGSDKPFLSRGCAGLEPVDTTSEATLGLDLSPAFLETHTTCRKDGKKVMSLPREPKMGQENFSLSYFFFIKLACQGRQDLNENKLQIRLDWMVRTYWALSVLQ